MPARTFALSAFIVCLELTIAPIIVEAQTPKMGFGKLHVRQEQIRKDGVLISRPLAQDRRMVDLIAMNRLHSLQDYSKWLTKNLTYQSDGVQDNWASPEETLQKRTGDCEDYAFLNSAMADVLGHRPHFLAFVRDGKAHAVASFQLGKDFVWFDNAVLKKTPAKNLKEFGQKIIRDYAYQHLFRLDRTTKRWQLVYSER